MLIKVSEATNRQIDWLAAKCEDVYLALSVKLDKLMDRVKRASWMTLVDSMVGLRQCSLPGTMVS